MKTFTVLVQLGQGFRRAYFIDAKNEEEAKVQGISKFVNDAMLESKIAKFIKVSITDF